MSWLKGLFSKPSPEAVAEARKKTQDLIDENTIMVFSKTYCPYSGATKLLLKSLHAKYSVFEINKESDGEVIKDVLLELTGQHTVPNIFINSKHIGGNSELQAIRREDLKSLLREAGALA